MRRVQTANTQLVIMYCVRLRCTDTEAAWRVLLMRYFMNRRQGRTGNLLFLLLVPKHRISE